jgi:signal transduction histidine kinase
MTGAFPKRILTFLNPLSRELVTERYTVAFVTALLAILLRWALDPVLGHVAFYVTVYIVVALCALICGTLPAILSGFLGFLGIFYWFVDPRHSFRVIRQSELHGIVGCFLVCAVLIALGEANRRKQLRLNHNIDALTNEARERRRAQEDLRRAHDELEQRVNERTHELSQALARLEAEVAVREQAEAQLRHLSLRLMTLQDEERRRIARELHDTAGQTLAAMKMSTALIRQNQVTHPDLTVLLDDLDALTDEALQEVRTTSYLLHPPLLDESGICSAARWFAEGFARRSGIEVHCDIQEKMERPSRECELVLFRILQEGLTNVHRHSAASAATVRLARDAGQFHLEVGDNGKGIPQERLRQISSSVNTTGVGIAGMRERVRELGGSIDIQSDETGTIIYALLPVEESSNASEASVPSEFASYGNAHR